MNVSRVLLAGTAAACIATVLAGVSPAEAAAGCVAPPDFTHTIPAPAGGPAAFSTSGESIYYATIGADRKVYAVSTTIDGADLGVGPLECKGGGAVDTPAVTETDTALALYVLASNGRIYENYSPKGSGSPAARWTVVPNSPSNAGSPAVVRRGPAGPIDLFVRSYRNELYHASRPTAADGTWSAWENLGGGLTGTPAAGVAPGGAGIAVVVRAPNGTLYQRVGTTGAWGPWTKLSGATSASPALATGFAAGRLDLFVTGAAPRGGLYQSTWTTSGWSAFRTIDTEPAPGARIAATGKNGRMIVYASALDGRPTDVGFDQYVPKLGWSGFDLAPYTCADCLP